MLTEGRSARDLLRKKIALYQQGAKKKNIRAPASPEESAGITPWERGSDSSGIREATQCTTRHSWPNALFLLRGQMVAYYHGWATVPRRERAATCPKKTSHALGDGSFRLGTHDARTSCIPLNGYKLQCF